MKSLFYLLLLLLLTNCQKSKEKVDLIIHNAKIYAGNDMAEAFAVKDGRFLKIGKSKEILEKYEASKIIDAQNKAVFPGFYDGHCHFVGYAKFLQEVNLVGTKSFEEILEKLQKYHKDKPNKKWIIGRGWDQNDWKNKTFPDKTALDSLFPNTPVFLARIDGHAALFNQKALDLAGITTKSKIAKGGLVAQKDGKLTGILIDNAVELVRKNIPELTKQELSEALLFAQEKCLALGLTTLSEAGLDKFEVELIEELQKQGKLKIRFYAMLSANEENLNYYLKKGIYKTDRLNVRSFKVYADGALGSRGACLLSSYSDSEEETGFLLQSPEDLETLVKRIGKVGFQVNTHCIGDSTNRVMLDIYGRFLKGKNDKRWRIEHAQIVSDEDLVKFKNFSIIPSVQPTHATSDMYWADERLGKKRIKTAYRFKELYEQNKQIVFGTDFPVESTNPFDTFHAAVARQDAKNYPQKGFQTENAVSRELALKAMTEFAAFGNFEENERGKIAEGYMADFMILEKDLMKVPLEEIREIKVLKTFINGELLYELP